MDYLAALKELYYEDYTRISVALSMAIRNDNISELEANINKYFLSPEAKGLFDGEIAYIRNAEDEISYFPPAFVALFTSSRKSMEAILALTRNPNARRSPSDGVKTRTLLMDAAAMGDYQTVKYLLEAGANPNNILETLGGFHYTALGNAASGSFSKTFDLLIERGGIATVGDLFATLEYCKPLSEFHSKLLDSNPNLINEPIWEGGASILHAASDNGEFDKVKWLISHGANVDPTMEGTSTSPLHLACIKGHLEIVKFLINKGANVDATSSGCTPLDFAIEKGKSDVASYLRTIVREEAVSPDPAIGKIDATKIVERLEVLEEKFGINLSALYVAVEHRTWLSTPIFQIWINFDVTSNSEGPLKESFYIKATVYNDAGQSIGVGKTHIYAEDFLGFDWREILVSTQQRPAKIRVFPAN